VPESTSKPIVLYDGVCGLCNRLNQFLLKRDPDDRFRFASLQSDFAAALLKRHGRDPGDLDTFYVAINYGQPGERLLARSDGVIYMLAQLKGLWSWARAGKVLPRVLRDGIYKVIARYRYRVFGKHETCLLPDPRHRHKFVDV
jgi:predicted DCC family thiol-disulfide oxidoreductase YuxK